MTYAHLRKMLMSVLRRGLGERAVSIVPVSISTDDFNVGIILNPDLAVNIVDKGPQSNEPEAEDFRKFWGKKSEIRRFKDGSITESVLWCHADAPIGEKRLICKQIVTFLLAQHFNIISNKINYIASQFDTTIRTIFNELTETNEERSLVAIRAFDELSKELRNLSNLPLEIVSVLGVDSTFRYTDISPPLANAVATKNGFINKQLKGKFLAQKVLNGIIQLSASGKWPDEVDAMQRIKAAFYNEISKKMHAQFPTTTVSVMPDCIEALKGGFVFRLQIVHPKEIALAKEEISPTNNLTKLYRENEESLRLEYESKILPKLTSYLHGLHHRFASFGPTAAIAKRWLYSQMIDSHLWPDECTELVLAEMFLKGFPMEASFQPQTGFIR
jgi:U3 small nucleolar RNA-associated protein 22